MPTKVVMEALSPTMEEGRLVKWLKAEGDAVAGGETLAEVETDKAIMELVARGAGVLRKIVLAEGGTAPVGSLVAVIAGRDENIDSILGGAAAGSPGEPASPRPQEGGRGAHPASASAPPTQAPASAPAPSASAPASSASAATTPPSAPAPAASLSPTLATSPRPGPAATDSGKSGAGAPPGLKGTPVQPAAGNLSVPDESVSTQGSSGGPRQRSSPLARRLASERGLDLESISGSGPGGRVIKRDVESAPASSEQRAAAAPAPAQSTDRVPYRDVPLTQIRKTIARRLAESIGPIPTFYLTATFDMERVAEMRGAMSELGEDYKASFNDIIIKATATALAQHPECNAHWRGDGIRYWNDVHIGMAVAVEDGLITPVIFNADRKRLSQIATEARDLAGRARARRLKPDEYMGSTFSVSNLGMFGIEHFTAIINPPEAGILAVGGIEPSAVVAGAGGGGSVVVRRRMRVTMSCDHRIIDGATGARFLQTLRRLIENPLMMVW
ncbi:MAG: dihydrolipoamide acetyltransferase family protein [Gemmatimonadota bacterium]